MAHTSRRQRLARQNATTSRAVMGLLVAAALSACAPKSAELSGSDSMMTTQPATMPSTLPMHHYEMPATMAVTMPMHHHEMAATMPATTPMHPHMMPSTMPSTMPMHHHEMPATMPVHPHMMPSTMPATMPMHPHRMPSSMPATMPMHHQGMPTTMPMHHHEMPATMPATTPAATQPTAVLPMGHDPQPGNPTAKHTSPKDESIARLAADVVPASELANSSNAPSTAVSVAEPAKPESHAGAESNHSPVTTTEKELVSSHEAVTEEAGAQLPGVARWAGVMVLISLGMFLAASVIGPVMRAHQPAEPADDAHGHDDPHAGGHDAHGGH